MSFWRKKEEEAPPARSRPVVIPPHVRSKPPAREPVVFDDAALLAELGFAEVADDAEAALMAAALALGDDDGEAELLSRLEGEDEEVTAVLAALGVLDEEAAADTEEELRLEVLAAKRAAVSAKQAGDIDRARQHLRRSKELQARLETLQAAEEVEDEAALRELAQEALSPKTDVFQAEAASNDSPPPTIRLPISPPSAARRDAILAAKREAVALKRAGDLPAAKAALARARELERLEASG